LQSSNLDLTEEEVLGGCQVDDPRLAGRLELLNTEAAATYLQLSDRTLEDYRVTASGPPFLRVGRGQRLKILYLLHDLNVWLMPWRSDDPRLWERLELLNTEATAEYVQLSERTLEDYRSSGNGPVFIPVGRGQRSKVLYWIEDVNAWVLAGRRVK
jgi:hypothetical protein